METNLFPETIGLLLMGMGISFVLLILAIFVTRGNIIKAFIPQIEQKESVKEERKETQTINVTMNHSAVNTQSAKIAAIIAAVQHHRNQKG
jgi:oxaloacetate decarboxylase gamma subunit